MINNPIKVMIDNWPNRQAFAVDVGASLAAVHKWAQNGRIPSEFQEKAVHAARDRGLDWITPAWMLRVHNPDMAAAIARMMPPTRQGKAPKKQAGAA